MSGYTTYTRYQRIEAQAKLLGFRLGMPNSRGGWSSQENGDMVSVYPDGEALPIYSRDADIFTGTFGQLEVWMRGWVQAQQYDAMLRMTDDKRRQKFEAAEVARQAEQRKREEQKKLLAVLRASDAENASKKR